MIIIINTYSAVYNISVDAVQLCTIVSMSAAAKTGNGQTEAKGRSS